MEFLKEESAYRVQYYYAIQPDYDHATCVAIHPGKLVNAIRMMPIPDRSQCTTISREEFADAFNLAVETFTDFLRIVNKPQ